MRNLLFRIGLMLVEGFGRYPDVRVSEGEYYFGPNATLTIATSPYYTTLAVDNTTHYFLRENGEYDGWAKERGESISEDHFEGHENS